MKRSIRLSLLATVVCLLFVVGASLSVAQDQGGGNAGKGGPGGGKGGRGKGGAMDPQRMQQFRDQMAQRMKEALKCTDEEWTAISPLIEKVTTLQRESRGGMGMMFGGGGDRGPDSNASPATDALRKALESETTPAPELQAKLKAYREERDKKTADLKTARETLRKAVNSRQEAQLVLFGILD